MNITYEPSCMIFIGSYVLTARLNNVKAKVLSGLARHESSIAQWLERPNGTWKVMGSIPVGELIIFFSEYFDLRAFLHFFTLSKSPIIYYRDIAPLN